MAKDHITLLRKLSDIGKEINTIAKSGRNENQHYDYAKEADFKRECRKPFFDRGLVLTPEILSRTNYEVGTKSGGSMQYVDVMVKFTVSDSETGESLAGSSTGTGSDMGDKAVYKAMAGAMKYWLAMTFMIPTGDDPEDDGNGKNTAQKPTNAPGAAQPATTTASAQGASSTGKLVLTFGKHKGETLQDVYADHPDYIRWLAGVKADGTPNSKDMQSVAEAFLGAQTTSEPPNWPKFWLGMHDLGLSSQDQNDKDFINIQAAVLFRVNGTIDKLIDVVKDQASLDLLSNAVAEAVMFKDGSRLPGE